MKILTAALLIATLPATHRGGVALSTQYKEERALRMEIDATLKLETTTMDIERDGEPVDFHGGMSSEATRKEVHVDRVLEAKEGKPTKVRRTFEKIGGKIAVTMADNSNDTDLESPLEDVTIEIARDEAGKVDVSAVEGAKPDVKALEGHLPDLFLDALLPENEVSSGSSWDLDKDAVRRALRLDVSEALFPRPERDENGGEGGGRRRGMRMGMDSGLLQHAEWKGKAKLVATDRDVGGVPCAVVEIKIEASGDLPEPEFGSRRGERAFEPVPGGMPAAKNTYDISLEGKLCFDAKAKRPVSFDLEGTAKTETEMERSGGEHTMKMHIVREGTVSYKVAVSEESAKGEK